MCTDGWKIIELMYGEPIPGSEKVECFMTRMRPCARCNRLISVEKANYFELDDGTTAEVCIECAIWLAHNAPEREYFYSVR